MSWIEEVKTVIAVLVIVVLVLGLAAAIANDLQNPAPHIEVQELEYQGRTLRCAALYNEGLDCDWEGWRRQ